VIWIVAAHFVSAAGITLALGKRRPLEVAIAFLLPCVGPFLVILQLLFERLFPSRSALSWSREFGPEESLRFPGTDVLGEVSVVPFEDVLSSGDPIRVHRAMRRMADRGDPDSLRRFREALGHTDGEIRACARSHLGRAEDQLLQTLHSSVDAGERGWTFWKLAALSSDAVTSRQRLIQSAAEFQGAGEDVALQHGRVLLELGDCAAALHLLREHLGREPEDAAAASYVREAEFRLGRGV